MRRFILTYTRDGVSIDIEGVVFSHGSVALEFYPDDDWHGGRCFSSLEAMNYTINEFGESSLRWLDEEREWTPAQLYHFQRHYEAVMHGLGETRPIFILTIEAADRLRKLGLWKDEIVK